MFPLRVPDRLLPPVKDTVRFLPIPLGSTACGESSRVPESRSHKRESMRETRVCSYEP